MHEKLTAWEGRGGGPVTRHANALLRPEHLQLPLHPVVERGKLGEGRVMCGRGEGGGGFSEWGSDVVSYNLPDDHICDHSNITIHL